MSAILQDLIGRIIDPRPTTDGSAHQQRRVVPAESVEELIGRIIGAPGATAAGDAAPTPAMLAAEAARRAA
jgi:hypothetical protein